MENKWISVKDSLPEVETEVLVSDGNFVEAGYFAGIWTPEAELTGTTFYETETLEGEITHWMPYPNPPNE